MSNAVELTADEQALVRSLHVVPAAGMVLGGDEAVQRPPEGVAEGGDCGDCILVAHPGTYSTV